MAKKILVYWRDIPAQVIIQRGRKREKVQLSHRFQEAIDRAAMRAGKGGSEAYIEEWRRETTAIEDPADGAQLAREEAEAIEQSYSDDQLLQMIRNHGVAE